MAKIVRFRNTEVGKISYTAKVVKTIILLAAGEVEGVASVGKDKNQRYKGVKLKFTEGGIEADVYIVTTYGYQVLDIASKIQDSIKRNVEVMTQFKIVATNVHVIGVSFVSEEE